MKIVKYLSITFLLFQIALPIKAQMVSMEDVRKVLDEQLNKLRERLEKQDFDQTVLYIHPNGRHADYVSISKKNSFARLRRTFSLEEEKNMTYTFPIPDSIKRNVEDSLVTFFYPVGGYTYMSITDLSPFLKISNDTFFYNSFDKRHKKGHYGAYYNDINYSDNNNGFNQYLQTWIFPEDFEVLNYKCNREGTWELKNNVLQFIAAPNQNNLLFEFAYRRKRKVPTQLEGREVKFVRNLNIANTELTLKIKDNAIPDGDIISLNLNGEWILKGFELTNQEIKLTVPASQEENFLLLFAENLGAIPPNTASLEISDGTYKYKIVLNADAGYCEGVLLNRTP